MQVRGEDLLYNPDVKVPEIARWMGLRCDEEAITATKAPRTLSLCLFRSIERALRSRLLLLQDPVLRPARAEVQTLAGPLPWSKEKVEFTPAVVDLARMMGYE